MKRVLALFIICLFTISVFGQLPEFGGVLRTEVNGNSVVIKLDSTWRNCGALYDQQIFFIGNTITWLQVDRGVPYMCDCIFNYSITLDSLSNGNYIVVVYYTEACITGYDSNGYPMTFPCDTTYQGSTTFTINNILSANPIKTGDSASLCLGEWNKVTEHSKDNLNPYPNPTYDFINIPIVDNYKPIELFDIFGHPVRITMIKKSGKTVLLDLTDVSRGIYYCRNSGRVYKVIKL